MKNQIRFTKKLIDGLPPCPADSRSREAEYSDTAVAGLRLIVSKISVRNPEGRKAFLFRYVSPDGRKRSMGLGLYPDLSLEDARERALESRRNLAHGIDPQDARAEEAKEALTFRAFVMNDFLPHVKSASRSYKDHEIRMRLHLLPTFGNKALADIKTQDIQLMHDRLRGKRCAATANRVLALLKRSLNLAILWGKFDGPNPVRGVKMHQENNQRHRYLEGEELRRFFAALDAESNRTVADFFSFLIATGARRSEALFAQWKDVHLDSARWFLPMTKSGRSRTVHLNTFALEILRNREHMPDNPYVFHSDYIAGEPLNDPAKPFKRILERAGIQDLRIHDLRHTHASLAINNAGASLYVVQHLLGHASSITTTRYAHLGDQLLKQTSSQVSDILIQASKPQAS